MSEPGQLIQAIALLPDNRAWLLLFARTCRYRCGLEGRRMVEVQTHGRQKEFVGQGKLASERAKSIEFSWVERGKRKSKLYSPKRHY